MVNNKYTGKGLVNEAVARVTLSHRSFCQNWGYLFSRRSVLLQLEVN